MCNESLDGLLRKVGENKVVFRQLGNPTPGIAMSVQVLDTSKCVLFRALAAAWSGSSVPFSTSSPYWLIPLILPPLGGTLGVGLHWVVNRHLPKLE